jgi:hypothetical protein
MRSSIAGLVGVLFVVGCDEPRSAPIIEVDVIVPVVRGGAAVGEALEIEPPEALVSVESRSPGRWTVAFRDVGQVRARTPSTCPAELARPAPTEGAPRPSGIPVVVLHPLYEIVGARDEIGFGEPIGLSVESVCDEMEGARYEWRNDGSAPDTLNIDGSRARGWMPSLPPRLVSPGGQPGVIALSPRTRGTIRLVLVVTMPDGSTREEQVSLHAAARTTGMPSVPTNVRVYLAGEDFATVQGPPQTEAPMLEAVGEGIFEFVAYDPGRYLIARDDGEHALSLFAGSYAATPLDCGRAECHAAETESAADSPMTTVLSRLIEDDAYTPGCAMGCHTLGEPGAEDGGFVHVARALGEFAPARGHEGAYDALPRELRRLSGVGCAGCHGPGAIPEPGARTRILRTDVCATCHDAPPRYGHVVAYLANRMSRAGRADGLDTDPRCASCHTTDGFLHGLTDAEGAPREVTMEGLGCATCHAPHDEDPGPALLRTRPLPPILEGVETTLAEHPSRICTGCHAPAEGFDLPTASATALLIGRGGYAADGSPLEAPAPHASLGGGCLACHGSAEAEVERGGGHSFAVSPEVCAGCHEGRDFHEERRALRARAVALFERAGPVGSRSEAKDGAPSSARARARWNAALVRFDRGAHAHAGPGASALLDAAEAALGAGTRTSGAR